MNRLYGLFFLIIPLVVFADDNLGIKLPSSGWPSLPIVNIETTNGVNPTCQVVRAPDDCIGISIINNNYVTGKMTITKGNAEIYNSGDYVPDKSGMKIKIRGNTSGQLPAPHYKLKFSKKTDLMGYGYKEKEWVLLKVCMITPNKYYQLNTPVGQEIARQVGMEWQPKYQYVNLVLNGNYRGLYLLSDAVTKGKGRCNIDDSGFLIENDAYWWNSDSIYFRTTHQHPYMGYTFKYPSPDDVTDSITNSIRNYIENYEDSLYSNTNADISRYIDEKSFAGWILAHDILGTKDAGGSNMYLYKKNSADSLDSTRLKMGPLWDFDTNFLDSEWSLHHTMNLCYFPVLFARKDFVDTYTELWKNISPHLCDNIDAMLDSLYVTDGAAIDSSLILDGERWGYSNCKLSETVSFVKYWFANRVNWINSHIEELNESFAGVKSVNTDKELTSTIKLYTSNGVLIGSYPNLEKMKSAKHTPGVYIYTCNKGKTVSSIFLGFAP